MDTGQIFLYAVLGLLLLVWLRRRIVAASIPHLSREEAEERVRSGGAVLVDVRTAGERSRKSIDDSLHVPMSDMTDIASRLHRYREKEVIFYCASGSRSISAAARAKKLGFHVSNLKGGIGW